MGYVQENEPATRVIQHRIADGARVEGPAQGVVGGAFSGRGAVDSDEVGGRLRGFVRHHGATEFQCRSDVGTLLFAGVERSDGPGSAGCIQF